MNTCKVFIYTYILKNIKIIFMYLKYLFKLNIFGCIFLTKIKFFIVLDIGTYYITNVNVWNKLKIFCLITIIFLEVISYF